MIYELYQNLGPLRSILKAPEHKSLGGGQNLPPPVQSRVNKDVQKTGKNERNFEKNLIFFIYKTNSNYQI